MGYLSRYLLLGLLAAAAAAFLFPKRLCLALGGAALVLGVAAPLAVWGYASVFVAGDDSAFGMLGTLLAVVFAPGGIALTVLGLIKGK